MKCEQCKPENYFGINKLFICNAKSCIYNIPDNRKPINFYGHGIVLCQSAGNVEEGQLVKKTLSFRGVTSFS